MAPDRVHMYYNGRSLGLPTGNTEPNEEYIRKSALPVGWFKACKCPACDGSGSIPHGPDQNGEWEAEQCEWCYERDRILSLLEAE